LAIFLGSVWVVNETKINNTTSKTTLGEVSQDESFSIDEEIEAELDALEKELEALDPNDFNDQDF